MSIVGRVEKWWNERNAVPEEKIKLLNERIARLFPDSTTDKLEQQEEQHESVGARKARA